jgi:hypothetical protein
MLNELSQHFHRTMFNKMLKLLFQDVNHIWQAKLDRFT